VRINAYADLARLDAPLDFASCHGPGFELKEIFYNDTDRSDFIDRLAALVEERTAVRKLGYSGADVARYSGVTNSCVTRFVASGKKLDIDDFIRML
jgi:hypothetical protein